MVVSLCIWLYLCIYDCVIVYMVVSLFIWLYNCIYGCIFVYIVGSGAEENFFGVHNPNKCEPGETIYTKSERITFFIATWAWSESVCSVNI